MSHEPSNEQPPNDGEDNKELQGYLEPLKIKPGEHKLQYTYCIWFSKRSPGKQATTQNFDQNLKLLGRFGSVEQFWWYYTHMHRPHDLTAHSDIHVFKEGIKPMWEDTYNQNGGKWIIRLRKGLISRCWENLLLAMLGEQFMVGEEICGAVVSVRYSEDILSLWNRTAHDVQVVNRIKGTLKRVLSLPNNTVMEYKTHNESLKNVSEVGAAATKRVIDHASYRNASRLEGPPQ